MKKKYVFKPYHDSFPTLFQKERESLLNALPHVQSIEHIGSTSVQGLGGKGIIDLALLTKREHLEELIDELTKIGYIYRPDVSNEDRAFFRIERPDTLEETRRYHLHVVFVDGKEWKNLIAFRDQLRKSPEDLKRYADAKKMAAEVSQEDTETYLKAKQPVLDDIKKKAME